MSKPKIEPHEVVVTPEMIAAGVEAFESVGEVDTPQFVEIIFRAMAAEIEVGPA